MEAFIMDAYESLKGQVEVEVKPTMEPKPRQRVDEEEFTS